MVDDAYDDTMTLRSPLQTIRCRDTRSTRHRTTIRPRLTDTLTHLYSPPRRPVHWIPTFVTEPNGPALDVSDDASTPPACQHPLNTGKPTSRSLPKSVVNTLESLHTMYKINGRIISYISSIQTSCLTFNGETPERDAIFGFEVMSSYLCFKSADVTAETVRWNSTADRKKGEVIL